MTSKLIVNELSADAGITTITVGGKISVSNQLDVGNIIKLGNAGVITATRFDGAIQNTGDFTIDDWIVHTGDTNTKFGFPSADTITAETGGSERLRIASDGDITHTGSDNVEYKMKCGTSSGNNILAFLNSGGTTRGNITYDSDNNFLLFNVNQAERLRITSAGKLGLGIAAPNAMMQIISDQNAETDRFNSSNYHLMLQNTGNDTGEAVGLGFAISDDTDKVGGAILFERSGGGSAGSLQFYTNSDGASVTERLRIESNGRIAVGGFSGAGSDLHIKTASSPTVRLQDTTNDCILLSYAQNSDAHVGTYSNHDLVFDANSTEKARITTAGRLGIGDASPSVIVSIKDTAPKIKFIDSDATGTPETLVDASGGDLILDVDKDNEKGSTLFGVKLDGSEKLRIDSGGSVTIGDAATHTFSAHSEGDDLVVGGSGWRGMTIYGEGGGGVIQFADNGDNRAGQIVYYHAENSMDFRVNGNATRLKINSTGGVGIGTNNFAGDLDNRPGLAIHSNHNDSCRLLITTPTKAPTRLGYFGLNRFGMDVQSGFQIRDAAASYATRMTILSDGKFGVGTSSPAETFHVKGYVSRFQRIDVNSGTHERVCGFVDASNSERGNIKVSNSSVQYNTSSDYRLKENNVAITDGITRLKTLKPYRFNWKSDASTNVDGFIAHEITAVPEAVSGTKDQVVVQSDVDKGEYPSDKLGDPIYQGVDYSKFVPLLTAALQEEITKREALEARISALEGS